MPAERVQKILAAAGYGSRRACEELIRAGRVRVNGEAISLGAKADPARDRITLDGEPVTREKPAYILLNKPRGVVSSLNPQGERKTVRDLVPLPGRLFPVGRLDIMSEGLILLTNDGELTNRLTHPRYGQEKEYHVLVDGTPTEEKLRAWRRGITLDGERTARASVRIMKKRLTDTWLRVVMQEGRKHQIRRVAQALGMQVKRLIRVRMGPLKLGDLKAGRWRELKPNEVEALRHGIKGGRKPPGQSSVR